MNKNNNNKLNEAEVEHLKAISSIDNMIEKDESLLKKVFPSGYENIELPVNMLAFRCPCCTARTSYIFRACKNNKGKETLFICQCFKCNTDYALFRKDNKINIVLLNYDIKK